MPESVRLTPELCHHDKVQPRSIGVPSSFKTNCDLLRHTDSSQFFIRLNPKEPQLELYASTIAPVRCRRRVFLSRFRQLWKRRNCRVNSSRFGNRWALFDRETCPTSFDFPCRCIWNCGCDCCGLFLPIGAYDSLVAQASPLCIGSIAGVVTGSLFMTDDETLSLRKCKDVEDCMDTKGNV